MKAPCVVQDPLYPDLNITRIVLTNVCKQFQAVSKRSQDALELAAAAGEEGGLGWRERSTFAILQLVLGDKDSRTVFQRRFNKKIPKSK